MKWTVFMRAFTLTHLSDAALLRDLEALVAQERTTTAALLAHIAEVDARRLYLPAGYASMYDYCVGKLRLSEDAAFKRIRAARTAHQFPAIFAALAEGRLHLSAVVLLTPHLTPVNADELLAAAAYLTKAEVEQLLARRFPKPDIPTRLAALAPPPVLTSVTELRSPGTADRVAGQLAPGPVTAAGPRSKLAPLSPERFLWQLTVGQSTHDKLRHAQDLLSHQIPSGDVAAVLDRALDALIAGLEKRKFAATTRPRASRRCTVSARHVPAHVKRAVWERDRGQCTFVGESGHRCAARKFLQFDHVEPVARGGRASVDGIRLRCQAHNQHEAENVFGEGFMDAKRETARRTAADARAAAATRTREAARTKAETLAAVATLDEARQEESRDVMGALRALGFRADEARRAAEFSATLGEAPLEERVRAALKFLCPKARLQGRTAARAVTPT